MMSALKTARNTAIVVLSLILLFTGVGLAYVFVSDNTGIQGQAIDNGEEAMEEPTAPEPSKPNPNNPVGVSVVSLLTPVKAGSNSSLTIRTTATATCSIKVVYGQPGNETQSNDSGLKSKVADQFGNVTWSWTVEQSVPTGKGTAKVTCKYGKKSGYVEGYLEIKAGG